ncbi:hypothetical protein DPMN_131153 [Dreissena polymorpha]|uniref:Uncharacterized protein n=1 Tax=Dreissena polymorpha TaxID=45954 RepID=A0A9D4H5X1_DREPO|nr:hypothetical protein DPMN_131123 [Dreissena polymorpha]KAH3829163.1 hypothetical protein DPMN_131153 [Dreissena polymorpha]
MLLDAFHAMKLKNPKVNKEQLLKLVMEEDNTIYEDEHWNPSAISEDQDKLKQKHHMATYHFPKLSKFYSDEGKGEVTWPTFNFELKSLIVEQIFSEEQILLGLRRALMGTAGDILRILGPKASVQKIIHKFESTFGAVDTQETILRKCYASQQLDSESIARYTSRVEEIYTQAITL